MSSTKSHLIAFTFILLGFIAGCDSQKEKAKQTPPANNVASDSDKDMPDGSAKKEVVFGDQFPEVLEVKLTPLTGANWRFAVTLSSKYDTPQRYADGWRVLDAEGQELGLRVLGHDHASEQPFTRTHSIEIPKELKVVYVEGRDQANGWSGQRFKVEMPNQ